MMAATSARSAALQRTVSTLGLPFLLLLLSLAQLPGRATPPASKTSRKLEFNRDIRPILSDNCFYCHGPNKTARQADLRLDERESALAKHVIVPGHPEKSALVTRILATGGMQMPPTTSHKTLTQAQKSLLKQWIAQGAEYQVFWAYSPPKRTPPPVVPNTPAFPIRNPIDAFILKRLEEKSIAPSKLADKRTLIRRVSLDLIGLPPTPEEVNAFLADTSPNAYEKLVNRLLASPHYGERMAVPWLDVVRYADTVGFHGDQNMNAWAYRDYVIDSFNSNKPFDQFTIEQLAGDLLPNPTPEQRTATCFNRLNMVTREGGAQAKEYLAKYTADRVRTVGMAWLGSTFACAECHDHKFDPITQKDFYSLGAFFADVKQWGVYADYGYTPNPELRGYNNDYPFPPEIKVESRYLDTRITRDRAHIAEIAQGTAPLLQRDANASAAFAAWRQNATGFLAKHADGWEIPAVQVTTEASAATQKAANASAAPAPQPPPGFHIEPDGSVLLISNPGNVEIALQPDFDQIGSLRLEVLPHAAYGNSLFRPGQQSATITLSAAVQHADGKKDRIAFRYAGANYSEPHYNNGFEVIGVQNGWKLSSAHATEAQVAVWLPATPIALQKGDSMVVTLPKLQVGCVRIAVSPFVPDDPGAARLPATLAASLRNLDLARIQPPAAGIELTGLNPAADAGDQAIVLTQYLLGTAWNPNAFTQTRALQADIFACRGGLTPVMVTEAVKPMIQRVLPRGNWQDESGEIVQPALPHFLPQTGAPKDRPLTRLDLAHWLVAPDNPLTARVFVNRLWKQFFGNGLSGQVEDLGAQGEWPSHPELLDWLAVEFREKGWDIKHMVRLIVTSSTYRQESKLRPELHDIDPNNRLLASQNPRRLEAEFVRDNALAIAGLLTPDLGGPPCKPYQPDGYYANIQFPDRSYDADRDDRQYRRGVYMHWQRTFLHPMLVNFDAPSREDCIAARTVSNTPQQALTLLNDPTFVEASRVLAAHLLQSHPASDADRLERLYQQALARSIKPGEKQSLLDFLTAVRAAYKERPEDAPKLLTIGNSPTPANMDPVELAAWTSVCRVVLNLHETITRY